MSKVNDLERAEDTDFVNVATRTSVVAMPSGDRDAVVGNGNVKKRKGKASGARLAANELNEQKLRSAMDRLLAGKSLHTNGWLTVGNLADEAGLTRPTAYRCEAVVAEFNEHVRRIAERTEAPTEEHLQRIVKLREELRVEKERSARYREEAKAAKSAQRTLANQVVVLDEKLRRLEAKKK